MTSWVHTGWRPPGPGGILEYTIRKEEPTDHRAVEELTRDAFWDVYVPGCFEPYLVHTLRRHPDFLPELSLVLEVGSLLVGSIVYASSRLGGPGGEKSVVTFGPVSIHPRWQRQGWGRKLIEFSFEKALEAGFDAVVIFGNPGTYVNLGFRSAWRFGISLDGAVVPTALLVRELVDGALSGGPWVYHESPGYQVDEAEAEVFDRGFPPRTREIRPSQEEFFILSRSRMVP